MREPNEPTAPGAAPRAARVARTMFRIPAMMGYLMFMLGPVVVLLRDEHGTTRTLASLHGIASAIGGIVAAIVTLRLVIRFGRRRVLCWTLGTTAAGVLVMTFGQGMVFSLSGVLICVTAGSLALNTATAVLARASPSTSDAVITRAHAVLATMGIVSPVVVALGVVAGYGWRPAFLCLFALAAFALIGVARLPAVASLDRKPSAVTSDHGPSAPRAPLPRRFWALFGVVIAAAATEQATAYWAGDLLRERLGVDPSTAALAVGVFVISIVAGRLLAARISRRRSTPSIIGAGFGVALVGSLLLWAGPDPVTAVAGMVLIGAGGGPAFPMLTALMSTLSPLIPERGVAWAGFAAAAATGAAPLVLAMIGDAVGVASAFCVIPVFLAAGMLLLTLGARGTRAVKAEPIGGVDAA